ncbi:MAG: glycosyltransferase family 9 protein [Gammaproteobacteria bacterium]|nr:MAG: glycosyltransferase family 9 protein [Gammaproteobacteria bacterium]
MATTLIRRLQEHHAGAGLTLLTAPAFAGLFRHWQGLRVVAFPRKGAMWQTLRWVRGERFDRIYDLQSSDRSALLCALSGAPERVGNHPRFPYTHHPPDRYRGQCHIFERMNQVLASAGVEPAAPQPHLPIAEEEREAVLEWVRWQGLEAGRFVVCHAGASPRWVSKRWPHFAALATALAERGLPCVWAGSEVDEALNRQLADQAGIDATARFSLPQLAELGRQARFAVTTDSAPMHVLSASGIPVYALFGPTDWRRNHALGQAERVLYRELDCSPCSLEACPPERGHACLAGITVEQVLERLQEDGLI